jgi:hypothetical protein
LEEWVPTTTKQTREESLAELARRYFTSHGPATLADFVWWSGLTTNDARRGVASVERDLDRITINENVYWSAAPTRVVKRSVHTAHLLPAYDEYNVAYKDRQPVIEATSGLTTWDALGPVVVVDGKLTGIWKATPDKQTVEITVKTARTLNKHEKPAITEAAERYAAFLDLSLKLSFR